eukprot:gb/GFBE01022079.1/.p1 GENE.gb/GFBE01022079.1/~~gb/GFBE01022079.1/.p1  ORF type:complete len:138 (+),score=12.27 gb/GFBE01022079.1/:1-414(+)
MSRMRLGLFILTCGSLRSCTGRMALAECVATFAAHDECLPSHVELLQQRLNVQSSEGRSATLPPMGFVKVHKTGGSTLYAILAALAWKHDLQQMLPPPSEFFLGWPRDFPGNGQDPPMNQYGFIGIHSVFNSARFRS